VDKLRLPALLRLKILCNQLQHTRQNLAHLEREIDSLLEQDPRTKGLQGVREFGHKTSAVLRAELGDVERFSRCDQAIAYAGLDISKKREWQVARTTQARPVEEVGGSGGSCTWRQSVVCGWKVLPLAGIITA